MNTNTQLLGNANTQLLDKSRTALKIAAASWYAAAVAGLSMFLVYVVAAYGKAVLTPELSKVESTFIPGDTAGNFFLASHLSLAIIVIGGGLLQLFPPLRNRYPMFHRWNGRLFMLCAIGASIAGQYLTLTREIPGSSLMALGTSTSGVLIIIFSALAYKTARAKRFTEHRRWAMRLFLVANSVWFFRIGLMLWLAIHQAPVGINFETFDGPFLSTLAYAQFLVPLAILQLYFIAQKSSSSGVVIGVASLIFICALATLLGVVAATMMMWLPAM